MILDVLNVNHVAGGLPHPLPFTVDGLLLEPSVITLSSQATGDGSTVLVARRGPGRVRIIDAATELGTTETTVVSTSGAQYDQDTLEFTSGMAVWFAAVAVQHKPGGSIDIVHVPGAIAAVASAAKPTTSEIEAFIGDSGHYVITGDVRFHRSADTVVQVMVDNSRRPSYVDEDNKTEYQPSQGSVGSLSSRFWGYIHVNADLTSMSAVADDATYVNGLDLPDLPFGGYIGTDWAYLPAVAGAGAGATLTARLALDGTDMTGNTLTITLALSAIATKATATGAYTGNTNRFKSGDSLDIEIDSSAVDFTAGSGTIQIPVYEYVQ
jgi:hypothetical protein